MVEEIIQVIIQSVKTVLEELCLETFVICYFTCVHHPNDLSNILVRQ